MRVLGRVVRRLGGPVTEQVHGNHFAAGIGNEICPARFPPAVLERRSEAMHQDYRLRSHPADRNEVFVTATLEQALSVEAWLQSTGRPMTADRRSSSPERLLVLQSVGEVRVDLVRHEGGGDRGLLGDEAGA